MQPVGLRNTRISTDYVKKSLQMLLHDSVPCDEVLCFMLWLVMHISLQKLEHLTLGVSGTFELGFGIW